MVVGLKFLLQHPNLHETNVQLDWSPRLQVIEGNVFAVLDCNTQLDMKIISKRIPVTGHRSHVTKGSVFAVLIATLNWT